jgi:hypothetical protein
VIDGSLVVEAAPKAFKSTYTLPFDNGITKYPGATTSASGATTPGLIASFNAACVPTMTHIAILPVDENRMCGCNVGFNR